MTEQSVGGFTKIVELTPTVEATPDYATGDLIGGKLEFTGAIRRKFTNTGIIQSVIITDKAKQSINIDVLFFDTDPSNTTFTENGVLVVHDTDLLNLVGVAAVTDWKNFSDNSMGQALNLGIPFKIDTNFSLWAAMVTRGAHNLASTSDLTIRVGILQD